MKYLALVLLCLLCACAREPGATLELANGTPHTLNQETRMAQAVQSPHNPGLESGYDYRLALGNPSAEIITVTVTGLASVTQLSLKPGMWLPLRAAVTGTVSFQWSGPALLFSTPYREPKGVETTSVMLVSVDTLRADHFSPEHMPKTFGLFESRGLITHEMKTTAPWTLPAHASLFTARYPASHGVRRPDQKLADNAVTLAEVLRDNGYVTVSVNEGNYVSSTFGLSQGFHSYHTNAPDMMSDEVSAGSKLAANLERMNRELESLKDLPVFAFFHTYEVHCPYVPRNGLTDPEGMGATAWLLENEFKIDDPAAYDHLKQLYAAETAYTDELLAPVLAELLDAGWLVALVSDHGEEFGERGGLLHADTLYEEVTAVPFALAGPGVMRQRLDGTSSIVDVAPTLTALLGLTPEPSWQGRDLLDPVAESAAVFSESYFLGPTIAAENARLLATWMGGDKLIQAKNFGNTQAELYNLGADPAEAADLVLEDIQKRDLLFLIMERYLKHAGDAAGKIDGLTPEQLETMRALGYIK